jgi:hypothetical protein
MPPSDRELIQAFLEGNASCPMQIDVWIGLCPRAGEIKADTPFGVIALRQHPALWAPFVLLGEP